MQMIQGKKILLWIIIYDQFFRLILLAKKQANDKAKPENQAKNQA